MLFTANKTKQHSKQVKAFVQKAFLLLITFFIVSFIPTLAEEELAFDASCLFTLPPNACQLVAASGDAMADTIADKDLLFVTYYHYFNQTPARLDVVCYNRPDRVGFYLARVIGLPGEVITFAFDEQQQQNFIYIDDVLLEEPYLNPNNNRVSYAYTAAVTLGENQFYLMGDRRNNSVDSRNIGPIDNQHIIAHVRYIVKDVDEWIAVK